MCDNKILTLKLKFWTIDIVSAFIYPRLQHLGTLTESNKDRVHVSIFKAYKITFYQCMFVIMIR